MDEANASYILQADRMGHEVPGMRGVYGHISAAMRAVLIAALQGMWEASLDARAALAECSAVGMLDALLAAHRQAPKVA